jgi:hypothetical protein
VELKARCKFSFSTTRTRARIKTTTRAIAIKTTTFFHTNTTSKPHICGETINNNQFQYRHTATPNKVSKILFRVYGSG